MRFTWFEKDIANAVEMADGTGADLTMTRAALEFMRGFDIAAARRNIAVAQYERTVQVAFREVADALAGRRYLADQRRAQEARLASLRARLRLIELRFTEGFSAIIDVLDARREIFTAEQQLVQTRREELSNSVALYTALGGGLI